MIEAGRAALGAVELAAWEDEAAVISRVYRAMATTQQVRLGTKDAK